MTFCAGRLVLNIFRQTCTVRASYACSRAFHLTSVWNGKIVPFNLSDIGEGIAEVQVKEWFVKPGDKVNQFDSLCEVQSDKASVTITSRYDGLIKKLHYAVDDIAPVGKPLVDIEIESEEDATETSTSVEESKPEIAEEKPEEQPSVLESKKVLAAPAVRRIAREHNLDLSTVKGTGKDGRVLKEDLLPLIGVSAAQVGVSPPDAATLVFEPSAVPAGLKPADRPPLEDEIVPIRGYSRIMVKTMSEANKIPHFGFCDEVNVNKLVDLRDQLKSLAAERGFKMTFMPLFIKAASLALHKYPILNSCLDKDVENVIYKAAHNICVAMDTPFGLVVPNIKRVEEKNLWDIGADLSRLQQAGQKGQISQEDLTGGTFTLSNIGPIGGTYAHPVIFPPQVAIGALGKMQIVPRYEKGELKPAHIINISWAADHRIIDGATMARYSNLWKEYLENPGLMIAELK